MSENKNSVNEKEVETKSSEWDDWAWLLIVLTVLFSWGNGKDPEKEMLKERISKLEGKIEMLEHIL